MFTLFGCLLTVRLSVRLDHHFDSGLRFIGFTLTTTKVKYCHRREVGQRDYRYEFYSVMAHVVVFYYSHDLLISFFNVEV